MNAYKIKKSYATAICRDCINANFVERSEKKNWIETSNLKQLSR